MFQQQRGKTLPRWSSQSCFGSTVFPGCSGPFQKPSAVELRACFGSWCCCITWQLLNVRSLTAAIKYVSSHFDVLSDFRMWSTEQVFPQCCPSADTSLCRRVSGILYITNTWTKFVPSCRDFCRSYLLLPFGYFPPLPGLHALLFLWSWRETHS